jgi:glycosyltransferase involved in cell wall biosynthesis
MKILYMGGVGFPEQLGAEISKQKLIVKGLMANGCEVLVVNRRPASTVDNEKVKGKWEGVNYVNAAGVSSRHNNFVVRNLHKIKGSLKEYQIIKKSKGCTIISNTRIFMLVMYYGLLCRMFRSKLYLTYVEYGSKMQERQSVKYRLNDWFFERYAFKLVHGVFPISEILTKVALKSNPNIKSFKLPPLVDTNDFKPVKSPKANYLLYCGAATYTYAIRLILDAMAKISDKDIGLVLVLYGYRFSIDSIKEFISQSGCQSSIRVLSKLEYSELIAYYQNALALLIPLKKNFQDEARFPQKIAEYAASSRPIVTTNIGEIKYYFTDNVNAYIAYDDSPELFAEKIEYVVRNKAKAEEVGTRGRRVALEKFDYFEVSGQMMKFLKEGR